jgi:LytS/YehU family sensor histidine kinase
MITDYMEMYRFRVDPQKAVINLEVEGEPDNLFIAPMLLVPFVENAFKHGLRGGPEPVTISIAFAILPGQLRFMVENSLGNEGSGDLDQKKGIGIENTRQRLELLYPGRHTLSISRMPDLFRVTLQLELE